MGTCWIPVPIPLLMALWIGPCSVRAAAAPPPAEAAICSAKGTSFTQQTWEIAENCPKLLPSPSRLQWLPDPLWGSDFLPKSLPNQCELPLKDSPGTSLSLHGGMPWSDWPQSMPVPLQHIMLQLPPCPLPGTLASPGAACDCSICGGFLFHLCSQSKAQLSPPRRALRAGSGGSWACYCFKSPFRTQVSTACTWPISPSVACLEQKDISWPEAVGNELCTLLPLSHLSPPVFYIFLGNKNETAWGRANKKHPQRPVPQCFSPALQVPSINRAGPAQPGKSHHTKLRQSPSHQLQQ